MSDVTDAIKDIKEAIAEYGSNISIITLIEGAYDPYQGATETRVETNTKALVGSTSTNEILNNIIDSYELSIRLYSAVEIKKDNLINFRGNDYKILYVDTKVLQNETLLYELLVQK